jgi:hypothetical protein
VLLFTLRPALSTPAPNPRPRDRTLRACPHRWRARIDSILATDHGAVYQRVFEHATAHGRCSRPPRDSACPAARRQRSRPRIPSCSVLARPPPDHALTPARTWIAPIAYCPSSRPSSTRCLCPRYQPQTNRRAPQRVVPSSTLVLSRVQTLYLSVSRVRPAEATSTL